MFSSVRLNTLLCISQLLYIQEKVTNGIEDTLNCEEATILQTLRASIVYKASRRKTKADIPVHASEVPSYIHNCTQQAYRKTFGLTNSGVEARRTLYYPIAMGGLEDMLFIVIA